jgi:hypothetical protein
MSMLDPETGLRTPLSAMAQPATRFGYNPTLGNLAASTLPSAGNPTSFLADLPYATSVSRAAPAATSMLSELPYASATSNPSLWSRFVPSSLSGLQYTLPKGVGGYVRAAIPALAGQVVGGAIESSGPQQGTAGDITQALGTGAKTAGLAASLTAPLGPEVAIPAGIIGFGVGLGGSALHAMFGEDNQPSTGDVKDAIAQSAASIGHQLTVPIDAADYQARFDTYKKLGIQGTATDAQGHQTSTGKAASDQELAQRVISEMTTEAQQKAQQTAAVAQDYQQRQADAQNILALQTQMRDFFAPYGNAILASGLQGSQILKNLASTAPDAYREVFNAQADQMANNALRTYGAYGMQIMSQPMLQYAGEAEKRYAQMSQNALDQMRVLAAAGNQGGGSSTDFSQLAAQTTPAG